MKILLKYRLLWKNKSGCPLINTVIEFEDFVSLDTARQVRLAIMGDKKEFDISPLIMNIER